MFTGLEVRRWGTQAGHLSDEIAVGVRLLPEGDGGVDAEELVEERRAGEPHPVRVVQSPVRIDEVLIEDLRRKQHRQAERGEGGGVKAQRGK